MASLSGVDRFRGGRAGDGGCEVDDAVAEPFQRAGKGMVIVDASGLAE